MEAVLKFSIPEETPEFNDAQHGSAYHACIDSILREFRSRSKWLKSSPPGSWDEVYQILLEEVRDLPNFH